jgi:hypothetical protein
MRLDAVSVQERLKAIPRFVVANNAYERHLGTPARGMHGDGGCAAESVVLFVHRTSGRVDGMAAQPGLCSGEPHRAGGSPAQLGEWTL